MEGSVSRVCVQQFADCENRLIDDIEEAIEQAADYLPDATSWWAQQEQGPRTIDTLIGMIVVAAKKYRRRVELLQKATQG